MAHKSSEMSNLNKSTHLLLVAFGLSPVVLSMNTPKELCRVM